MMAMKALHPSIMVCRSRVENSVRHRMMQFGAEGLMTDMSGSRLWSLALMGWLAAYPPEAQGGQPGRAAMLEEPEAERSADDALRPGQRTAWLRAARQRYAALSREERQALRQTQAVQRRAGFGPRLPDPMRG